MTFIEFLEDNNVPFARHGDSPHVSEGWIGCLCPRCDNGQGNFGLGYSLATGATVCWGCGPIRMGELIALLTGKKLAQGIAIARGMHQPRFEGLAKPTGRLRKPAGIGELAPAHRRYLRAERGLDPDEIARLWSVQAISVHAYLSWRLFIPIFDRGGREVSWTTRAIGSVSRRYWTAKPSEEMLPAKSSLYGSHLARQSIIICEGPVDAWRIGPGAVATLGVGYSRAQVYQASKYPVRAVCYDSSSQAQQRAKELCRALEPFPGETYRVEIDADDPGSAGPKEVRKLRRAFLD